MVNGQWSMVETEQDANDEMKKREHRIRMVMCEGVRVWVLVDSKFENGTSRRHEQTKKFYGTSV